MSIETLFSAASGVVEAPDLWTERLPKRFKAMAPQLAETSAGLVWRVGDRTTQPLVLPGSAKDPGSPQGSVVSRDDLAWLSSSPGRQWIQQREDAAGEVLYSVGGVWRLIHAAEDADFIASCTGAYNDWLAELCATAPDRFIGVAKIPTTGVEAATAELIRASELGLRGAVLDAWPGGPDCPPAMRECDGFWEAAAALNLPISIHKPLSGGEEPIVTVAGGAIPEYFSDLTSIIYANIPDRFPKIRFISVAPNAGWAPPTLEALNESYMRTAALRRVNLGDPDLYPSDYLRRFFYYVAQDDRIALLNRSYFGEAHLLWGSYALMGVNSAWPDGRQLFEQVTAGLPDPFRAKLAGGNVSRLYGLAASQPFTEDEVCGYDSYALI